MSSSLTDSLRGTCRFLVHGHIPDEERLFEQVWLAFWRSLHCHAIEELERCPLMIRRAGFVVELGAVGPPGTEILDSLYLIGTIVQATLSIAKAQTGRAPLVTDVATALREAAASLGAPERVRSILEQHGLPLLAAELARADWAMIEGQPAAALPYMLCVQWCDTTDEVFDYRRVQFAEVAPADAARRFVQRRERFLLFVDERDKLIFVHASHERAPIGFAELDARHLFLLGLILRAFGHGQGLTYVGGSNDMDGDLAAIADDWRNVRRTKQALDDTLGGILKDVVVVKKHAEQLHIEKQLSHCWIRVKGTQSTLLPRRSNQSP